MLTLRPIGVVHTAAATRAEAARQSAAAEGIRAEIELYPAPGIEHALTDLSAWDMIWVIYWFHLNEGWRPKVLPPRSRSGRKGVFSTRSPHRPNPLGLSALRLDRVEGLRLHVLDADMLDGTPVLDIKPYVAYTDARPQAGSGWLGSDPLPGWAIDYAPAAAADLAWLESRGVLDLRPRIEAVLGLGPEPHPYRRIRAEGEGFRLAVRDWRVRFAVRGQRIEVESIMSGYRPAELARAGRDPGDPRSLHRAFAARR